MGYKIAGEDQAEGQRQNLMKVDVDSEFARTILHIFGQVRPRKLVETGTFVGTGTTAIQAIALRQLGIEDAQLLSIEVNPQFHAIAAANLNAMGLRAHLLLGLSVPRSLLPTREQIRRNVVETTVDGIYVDHAEQERAGLYFAETDFPGVEDDLLGKCLTHFENRPDVVLLDSAGHLGQIEFEYTIPRLRGPCIIALDDTNHVKHYRSVETMKSDARFSILAQSREKFGFCIARFTPDSTSAPTPS